MSAPRALALSPHLDDAVFSCGGTLARLARLGWRVTVATLFTASVPDPTGFALACQLDKGLGPEVDYMALRRTEDRDAAAALGGSVETAWLPFREAPHRGYGSAPELFGPVRDDDGIAADLADAVREIVGRSRPDLILAPQAVGGHVDHVQIVRAIDAATPDIPVAWWRDFPYVTRERSPAEPFGPRFAALPEREVALDGGDRTAKEAACLAYRSQIGFQFGGTAALSRALAAAGDVERFRGAPLP